MKTPKIHVRDFFWLALVLGLVIVMVNGSIRVENLLREASAKQLAAEEQSKKLNVQLALERETTRQLRLAITSKGFGHVERADGTVYLYERAESSSGPFTAPEEP